MRIIESAALAGVPGVQAIHIEGGVIAAIEARPAARQADCWVTPPFVNAHAHANRAFSASAQGAGGLQAAVQAARLAMQNWGAGDIQRRSSLFFQKSLRHGVCHIRTHTDVDATLGLTAVHEVLAAARPLAPGLSVELVAFANASADPVDAQVRDLLLQALHAGADLLGAAPALYADPAASLDAILDLAAASGRALDLHLDEHLNSETQLVERLIAGVEARALQQRVTLSHACVLSSLDPPRRTAMLDAMARAGIGLVVLPELNLYLQGRSAAARSPQQRGLAPVLDALASGVTVRFGTDNVRDWFFPFGDGDMLSTGYTGMLAAHLDRVEDVLSLICGGRHQLKVGDVADLVLIPARSWQDAIARLPAGRVVLKAGQEIPGL